ncbi:MAG: HD domain-containing protein [Crenarchaeota archaeon]|nr:HD domain-containing protein [Thermoproteota archaeon]
MFNDLLVYAFKYAPFEDFLVLKKNGEERAIPAPQDVFYTFYLLGERPTVIKLKKFMEEYAEYLWTGHPTRAITTYLTLREFKESVGSSAELALYLIPADTRPGLNVSSLPSHSLMTSALVVAKGGDELERACALLHDVGKALNPKRHTIVAEKFLEDVKEVFGKDYQILLECVKKHHSEDANPKIKEADRFASSSDRIRAVYRALEDELRKVLGEGYEAITKTFESYDWETRRKSYEWIEKNEEMVRTATELISEKLLMPDVRLRKYSEEKTGGIEGIYLLVVDIGGIQKSLSDARKLRSLSGLSYLVELITHVIVPYEIISKFGVKPENVIFSGGGSVQAVVPDNWKLDDLLDDELLRRVLPSLRVSYAYGNLNNGFIGAVKEAFKKLKKNKERNKKQLQPDLELIEAPGKKKCQWCQRRLAVTKIGDEEVCLQCALTWTLTSPFGFAPKGLRYAVIGKIDSGDPLETIKEGEYVSYVTADGNFMGLFMSSSLTPSIYQEKSLRIDVATKRSLRRLLEYMRDEYKEKFVLGFLYAGGDDFNAVLSPSLAIVLAPAFTYSFSSELGMALTSSVGVATARYTAPIWELRNAAEEIMEKVKDAVRPKSYKCMTRKEKCSGYFAALFATGMLSRVAAEDFYREVYDKPLVAKATLLRLAELLGRSPDTVDDRTMDEIIKNLLGELEELKRTFKDLRKLVSKTGDDVKKIFYYITKREDEGYKLRVLLDEPFFSNNKVNLALFDIFYKHLTRG